MKTEAPQSPPGHPTKSTAENIKETLESIVVAFILAFVFRAFIVEAFVIPTGSMAVTLYGNQATVTCSICGFEYARGIDQHESLEVQYRRRSVIPLRCPNCDSTADQLGPTRIVNPDSGDRILVHKWPFDIGGAFLGPNRWDVTVFKDPMDGTTNFIKRLVGVPGEVLQIIDGDVYTASLEKLEKADPEIVRTLEELRLQVYLQATPNSKVQPQEIVRRYAEISKRLLPYLEIRRKLLESPRAQQALWRNVYNHDFLPSYDRLAGDNPAADPRRVGWRPESNAAAAWNTSQREITFESASTDPLFIRFEGKPIDDFCAYNSEPNNQNPDLVGDVRLSFTWFPDAGDGAIQLQMNRDEATFVAEIQADGTARILHQQPSIPGGQAVVAEGSKLFQPGREVTVEFMNVDHLVRLVLNDQILEAKYQPDLAQILSKRLQDGTYNVKPTEVRIGAWALKCRFRHVLLERDVYYRDSHQAEERRDLDPSPERVVAKANPFYGWPGWGTSAMPILLRPAHESEGKWISGEYFMLGDNSPASKDSRLWWEIGPHLAPLGSEYTYGTVPGDELIGEAFFVYWPAGYRLPRLGNIGLIPNVGRMRWIR